MNDDPFSDDESVRAWQETGPARAFDTVEVRLTGEVLGVFERHGVELLRVAIGPFEHSREETVVVLADSVAVVKRYEPAARTRRAIVTGGRPGMTTADVYEVDEPGEPGR